MTAEELFRGRLVMAPMARGTDLPFRRLVSEFGCEVAVGEMAFAHKVVKRDKRELALLRRHPGEANFGAQLCGKKAHVLAEAAQMADSSTSTWAARSKPPHGAVSVQPCYNGPAGWPISSRP